MLAVTSEFVQVVSQGWELPLPAGCQNWCMCSLLELSTGGAVRDSAHWQHVHKGIVTRSLHAYPAVGCLYIVAEWQMGVPAAQEDPPGGGHPAPGSGKAPGVSTCLEEQPGGSTRCSGA
jgi:hypothetical protein